MESPFFETPNLSFEGRVRNVAARAARTRRCGVCVKSRVTDTPRENPHTRKPQHRIILELKIRTENQFEFPGPRRSPQRRPGRFHRGRGGSPAERPRTAMPFIPCPMQPFLSGRARTSEREVCDRMPRAACCVALGTRVSSSVSPPQPGARESQLTCGASRGRAGSTQT